MYVRVCVCVLVNCTRIKRRTLESEICTHKYTSAWFTANNHVRCTRKERALSPSQNKRTHARCALYTCPHHRCEHFAPDTRSRSPLCWFAKFKSTCTLFACTLACVYYGAVYTRYYCTIVAGGGDEERQIKTLNILIL